MLSRLIDITELAHLTVHVEQRSLGIIERHGNQVGVEHLLVLAGQCLDVTPLGLLDGNVLGGIDNEDRLAVFLLNNGIAIEVSPQGVLGGAQVETEARFEMVDDTSDHLHVECMELLGLFWRHVLQEVLRLHVAIGQHVTILVVKHVLP